MGVGRDFCVKWFISNRLVSPGEAKRYLSFNNMCELSTILMTSLSYLTPFIVSLRLEMRLNTVN
jgi:hypothetical protein